MRYQSQSTVSKSFQWAIVFFSVESFITTTCGVASLGSALAHDPVTVGVCWAVAVLVAGALAISMAGMSHRLYRRVTFPPLIALIILASCAILFDAAFFNELYMVTLQGQTGDLHDKEYRQKE